LHITILIEDRVQGNTYNNGYHDLRVFLKWRATSTACCCAGIFNVQPGTAGQLKKMMLKDQQKAINPNNKY